LADVICHSYIILFNPVGNPLGTRFTATQKFNRNHYRPKRGSRVTPYPEVSVVYERSALDNPGDDMFKDLFLDDLWVAPYPELSWMINIPILVYKPISTSATIG
jgi:hypothetical protein